MRFWGDGGGRGGRIAVLPVPIFLDSIFLIIEGIKLGHNLPDKFFQKTKKVSFLGALINIIFIAKVLNQVKYVKKN